SPPSLFVDSSDVSQAVFKVIEHNRFELVMPRWLALICWLKRVSPGLFRYLAQRRFRRHVVVPGVK
ncbi:MAG: hypothetical protein ACXW6K_13745, partial [Candidatus Binatia bacterium]